MIARTLERPASDRSTVDAELDAPVRVISSRWLAGALALMLLVATVSAWALFGSVTQRAVAVGIVVHAPTPTVIRADHPGSVREFSVRVGDPVAAGQRLGTLVTGSTRRPITAPLAGTVLAIDGEPGRAVLPGAALLTIDPARGRPIALLSVDGDGADLRPGQVVVLDDGTAGHISAVDVPVPHDLPDLPTARRVIAVDLESDRPAGPVSAVIVLPAKRPYQLMFGG